MIKIAALNEESDEESDSEEEVTREALEQIALQQYAKALDLQRKGNVKDALQLLKDLLDTELLYEVKKPAPGEQATEPLFNLKYLCYKNVAAIQSSLEETDAAVESYCAAAELDDTDVTLWHRFGQLCLRTERYDMALNAFQRGATCNPRHWPCLDKIVTLLLGLGYYEDCIVAIYDALQLDPGYLRGLAYRKHIYTSYPYIHDFMEYTNKKYKWNKKEDDEIDEIKAAQLLKEAQVIFDKFQEQQRAEEAIKCVLPDLKLQKPITSLTWSAVGESIVHMHNYMTENYFSHACFIEMAFKKEEKEEIMEVCEEPKKIESSESKSEEMIIDLEKNGENGSENDNNDLSDKEKVTTDTEKEDGDNDASPTEANSADPQPQSGDSKELKKPPVRRRGSDLSFLQQWEWCNKRKSGRKKQVVKDTNDNIYDTLRKMVPTSLVPEIVAKKESQKERESSPDVTDIEKLFEEKDPKLVKSDDSEDKEKKDMDSEEYFGTENEQKDVESFINKYTENKRDIIEILKEFLQILSSKWKVKWPERLPNIFVEANKCYGNHIDVPTCTDDNIEELLHYVHVNILTEEFTVNRKLNAIPEDKQLHELNVIETLGLTLAFKPHIFGSDCLETMLRYLWVKLHAHLINKNDEFALDCLYQLSHEFEAMGEHHETFTLKLENFSFKNNINENEIAAYIKFLERNKRLSTVMELYECGKYDEVLSIVIDSFEHCKDIARKQEEEMSLDFAVQLSIILDAYWALDKVDDCFKWSLICLHEALKHFFHYTSGCQDYEKWALAVVKILCCMEHVLSTEGLYVLDNVSRKDLSQGLDNLIRIIGHQVETSTTEMPFGTVVPWIIMYYILQREEDQGRGRTLVDKDMDASDDVPNPLMVLFLGHEKLGSRGWCCKSDAKLLYFILDTLVPRLRSPLLARSLEQILQYMEQCVYCLFGHPGKKNKVKYLEDHNATPHSLDWPRAQQIYEIFRPIVLPELHGKVTALTADTEHLFHRILGLLPPEYELQKYVPDLEKFMTGKESKMPSVPPLLPYKMKDIYFLLGDYYFKKEEGKMSIKYNMFDVIINNSRFESWAEITLAKAINLERMLNSCNNINNEKDFMRPAKTIIRCFKRTLDLESNCDVWVEYGVFSYAVHSFCSRLLKQASESLSMEDFESLENQKDEMLETTQKCFGTVSNDLPHNPDPDKVHEGMWLSYYLLGKVAEKRNKPPAVYTELYLKSVKCLHEAEATYPSKINYNSPQNYAIEVLELHYRIHASILKYIEQHENKPIPASIGKVFLSRIEEWKTGPFTKKPKKVNSTETTTNSTDVEMKSFETPAPQAANILKRSISDVGEEDTAEAKRLKLDSAAAKIRRSASYDTERLAAKEPMAQDKGQTIETIKEQTIETENPPEKDAAPTPTEEKKQEQTTDVIKDQTTSTEPYTNGHAAPTTTEVKESKPLEPIAETEANVQPAETEKKGESSSSTSSSSSSSSSSDSSSDSTSDSSRDSDTSSKSSNDNRPLTDDEIMNIISACLDALEDCVSRFPLHYKALYRIAHYHFYYKKGKDIERCRDIMLTSFTSKLGNKVTGLFGERKTTNFFNNIWRIPLSEIDRPGGFANHMNRCVLLTMEILKEIDDHKTLQEMSMQLQRIPEPDKKYLRDSDREELAQQAFSLCVQSLKGQLQKFSQQTDLKSNEIEKKAFNSLMLDIYRAYQKAQKQPNSKQFVNLLVDGYKLITTITITETTNLVDLSMKYCQSLIQALKQQATLASLDKTQNAQKKQATKSVESAKISTASVAQPQLPKVDAKQASSSASALPKMSTQDMTKAFQSCLPMLSDPVLSQQAAAALSLSYLSNMSAYAGYSALQNTLQSSLQTSLQNSFQAEFYRQFLGQNFSSFLPPPKKQQKRGPKPRTEMPKTVTHGATTVTPLNPQMKGTSKSYTSGHSSYNKTPTSVATITKSASTSASSKSKPSSTTITSVPKSMSSNSVNKTTPMALPAITMAVSSMALPTITKAVSTGAYGTTKTPVTHSMAVPSMAKSSYGSKSSLTGHSKPSVLTSTHKPNSSTLAPSMGTVLQNLPASLTAAMQSAMATSSIPHSSAHISMPAHITSSSTVNAAIHPKPPLPHQQVSPGKTLQEKLAERQKNSHDLSASIGRLPSSLTITKSGLSKPPMVQGKKSETKKSLNFESERPKPLITSDEVIVLDDDD
ncbi:unnamed protein product [Plutella xylostella]|uniref:(diamondback moth) hypothetical protein n=1 Tax=Plutella xylostella TaxID=51655 RepID=A0A8S4FRE9_PLUXY|nr:unnamed protein product [Plutella xylostella]